MLKCLATDLQVKHARADEAFDLGVHASVMDPILIMHDGDILHTSGKCKSMLL
jgi:hypothetical protein